MRKESTACLFLAASLLAVVTNVQAAPEGLRWIVDNPATFNKLSGAAKNHFVRKFGLQNDPRYAGSAGVAPAVLRAKPHLPSTNNVLVDNPLNAFTQNETCAAIATGGNVIVSFNDATDFSNFCGYGLSTDGGVTFTYAGRGTIPDYTGGNSGGLNLGDGTVMAGQSNVVYYSMLAFDLLGKSTIACSKSINGGATFLTPFNVTGAFGSIDDFQDKPWMAVDRSNGNVYVTWSDFFSNSDAIYFTRSLTGGAAWSTPINLSATDVGAEVQGSQVVVGPGGEVYVCWMNDPGTGIGTIRFRKSTDHGLSFSPEMTAATFTDVITPVQRVDVTSFPSLAVNPVTGEIGIVFANRISNRDKCDIGLVTSTDGGATWSSISRVNNDRGSSSQYFPSIAYNTLGTRAIMYNQQSSTTSKTDIYASVGGVVTKLTDTAWSLGPVQSGLRANYHGDYNNCTTDGVDFLFPWGDERSGDPDTALRIVNQ